MCLLGITCAHVNEHLFEGNLPSNRCCIGFLKEFEAGTRFPSRFLKFQLKVGDIRQYPGIWTMASFLMLTFPENLPSRVELGNLHMAGNQDQ